VRAEAGLGARGFGSSLGVGVWRGGLCDWGAGANTPGWIAPVRQVDRRGWAPVGPADEGDLAVRRVLTTVPEERPKGGL
jgi:hypothetical protein